MKKLLVEVSFATCLIFIFGNALADTANTATLVSNPSFYMGLQGAIADSGWHRSFSGASIWYFKPDGSWGRELITVDDSVSSAMRVSLGYNFNANYAIEAGYTYLFTTAKFYETNGQQYSNIRTQIGDLVGKMTVPINNKFDLYSKFGAGYLVSDGLVKGSNTDLMQIFFNNHLEHLGAVYGLGFQYHLTSNLLADISWTRYQGNPNQANYDNWTNTMLQEFQPDVDLYALGLSYKIDVNHADNNEVPVNDSKFKPGFYLGVQGGVADTGYDIFKDNQGHRYMTIPVNAKVLGGRIFAGYDLCRNFAVETGYTALAKKTKIKEWAAIPHVWLAVAEPKTSAWDLVGKLKLPLAGNFGLYSKAGVAYLMTSGLHDSQIEEGGSPVIFFVNGPSTRNNLALTYGVGMDYMLNQHVTFDLSWTRDNGRPTERVGKVQPNLDLFAFGIAYKF